MELTPKVLLAEDNRDLARSIAVNLEMEGYAVELAAEGPSALRKTLEGSHDLLILDIMLPGMDGFEVLERLRAEGKTLPVLMLTARGTEGDKVRGFRAGADQYLTKPFGLLELLERVRVLLQRHGPRAAEGEEAERFCFGDVEVDRSARTIYRRGEEVALPPRAFDLLVALYDADGRVLSRVELMRHVWGHKAAVLSRTVDVHISHIRHGIEDDPSAPRHVLTVWKAGYRLAR